MTDALALDAVTNELERRIDRYLSHGEAAAVLDDAGSALLTRARQLEGQGELTARIALVLARFHWCRGLALPEGAEGPDQAHGIELFAALWRADPNAVPPSMRKLLEENEGVLGAAYDHGGSQLFELSERTGDRAALDNALDMFAKAVAAVPGQRRYQSNLAGACLARYVIASDPADLDIAIKLGAQACALDGGDEQIRAATLGNLAVALRTRYERVGDPGDLEAAIGVTRNALNILPARHPDASAYLAALAVALRMRFERAHEHADLDEAFDAAQRAVNTAPADDPGRPALLSSLASCALARYDRHGDFSDLELAIDSYAVAVEEALAGQSAQLGYLLMNFGMALRQRYLRTGSLDDLDVGVDAAREAVAEAPPHHTNRPALLSNLAALLRTRALHTGSVADLDAAVAAAGDAVSTAPAGPSRPVALASYAVALLARFERAGAPADLDAAIDATGAAVAAMPADHPERWERLSDLGSAVLLRYVSRGDQADLDAAVGHARDAVTAARPDAPDLGRYLSNLAYALRLRAAATDDPTDLDAAVAAGEEAAARLTPGRPERAAYLVNLASALASRFQRSGDLADLDGAVERAREAIAQTPDDHADLARRWNSLGLILRVRFERTGRLADADEAVVMGRRACAATPGSHAERPGCLTNLATTLRMRFCHTSSLADLDDAVDVGREAVASLPEAHPERGGYLANLSNALRARFDERGEPDDLVAALDTAERAVTATSGAADRAKYLSNLSAVLLSLVEHDPAARDRLDAAIAAAAEAAESVPAGHPDRARFLANLGNALITRSRPEDLARAVAVTAEAVRATPPDDPDHAGFLFTAGQAQYAADPAGGVPEAWRAAARGRTGLADMRLRAAWAWGHAAATADDAADAAAGFGAAVALLPVLAWRGLDRVVREQHLWRSSGLASDACAWALRAGDPQRAVELLEQGRSITWNQVVQTRSDLTAARAAAPELVARLDELRAALDAPALATGLDTSAVDRERIVQAQRRLAEEWDEIVDRVRGIDGLETFLAAVPYKQLAAEAAQGPIVVINLSRYGCCAIALTKDDPVVVDLPALTRAATVERANALLQTRLTAERDRTFASVRAAHRALLDTLAWLYDTVIAPVLAALAPVLDSAAGDAQQPRIWWCPTGPLTMLPLHAAGHHAAGRTDTLLDRVVSSYLPTIGTLQRARTAGLAAPARALVVDQSAAGHGLEPLPFAAQEARRVRQRLPDGRDLSGAAATAEAVLAGLADHAWVHLSCHGGQNLTEPASSALYLDDRPLTVTEIAGHRFPGGQLAYLSACETSTGGVRVLDEAMHLSAAFQVAGFRHVIATLWTIMDDRSMAVADDFYTSLTAGYVPDAAGAARALHRAVAHLRARYPYAPLLWAPYVHSGP